MARFVFGQRQDARQQRGRKLEPAAVEPEVYELVGRLIFETTAIQVEQQRAVERLPLLVPSHPVFQEGATHEREHEPDDYPSQRVPRARISCLARRARRTNTLM